MTQYNKKPSAHLTSNSSPDITESDLEVAKKYHQKLKPALNARNQRGKRGQEIKKLAEAEGVGWITIHRRVRVFEEMGMEGLAQSLKRKTRSGRRGSYRSRGSYKSRKKTLPSELVQLIQAVWINNPTIGARKVHRTIQQAAPDFVVVKRKNGRAIPVSHTTVWQIRKDMEEDPTLRLLLVDEDQRQEYIRAYSGEVLAIHANDMWQLDITQCDIMVYDPEIGSIYRPYVQIVIDVYSGCIMGISFSDRGDHDQANLALARALVAKPATADQPAHFSVAKRLYINSESDCFHDIAGRVGMTVIHSKARTSYARGNIEGFFEALHSLEKGLIGYCGENASKRSDEELEALRNKTLAWAREGEEFEEHQRLMTLSEYQNAVLKWLAADYHQQVVHEKTRMEHFVETEPMARKKKPVETMPAEDTAIIPFHDSALRCAEVDGIIYVAVKPICEHIGIDWRNQHTKLVSDDRFNHTDIRMVSRSGATRKMICLPQEQLLGWLSTIKIDKVKPEARELLLAYKTEMIDAINDY